MKLTNFGQTIINIDKKVFDEIVTMIREDHPFTNKVPGLGPITLQDVINSVPLTEADIQSIKSN